MNPTEDNSGITELVQGDMARARQIRTNLAAFSRKVDSPDIRKLVSEVLAGRRSFRDVVRTKEFNEVGMRGVTNLEKGIARLTDEQRAELWNSALSRNTDHAQSALRGSGDDDRPHTVQPPTRPKVRKDIDDEDQDFSQNTYAE
jgi:hypothetical protein